jgi:hypothetical protein
MLGISLARGSILEWMTAWKPSMSGRCIPMRIRSGQYFGLLDPFGAIPGFDNFIAMLGGLASKPG